MKEDHFYKLIDHYRKALQIKPNNLVVYNQLAKLYYERGELEKTLEVCQEALQIQSDLVLVSKILYQILQRLGFNEEEIEILQKGIQNKSGEEVFQTILSSQSKVSTVTDAKTWKDAIALGYILRNKTQWNEAIDAYLKAIEIEPALSLPYFELHGIIISSRFSFQPNQLETVINCYSQLIKGCSTPSFAYVLLGDMLTKQGKIAESITSYKRAIYQRAFHYKNYPSNYRSLPKVYEVKFLIIGIGKSGTSALYYYLCEHPQIIPPTKKELHFFNENFEFGLDWYLAQFPPLLKSGGFLTGEATPWYLGSDGVEEKVFKLFPKVKLIVVLRNPVARAISHYYMMNFRMKEHRLLETAMTEELKLLKEMKNPLEISEKYWQTEKGYLWSGLYVYFLEKWMALFPREQFLILRSEDLYNQTAKTMQQVYEFLGIPDYPLFDYPKHNSGSYPNVSNELRQKLSEFFRPHNQKLEDYLRMKFDWR